LALKGFRKKISKIIPQIAETILLNISWRSFNVAILALKISFLRQCV